MVPKISICVPIYNQEKYLDRCIQSLINQTLSNIEIVLVNDGSTDKSFEICRKYAEIDRRIVIVNKDNGGSASARQAALEIAKGEYIASCDSDDWLELNMCELLYNKAKEKDYELVVCRHFINYESGGQVEQVYEVPCNNEKMLMALLLQKIPGSICNRLVRRDVFKRFELSWTEGINLGEDVLMNIRIAKNPVSIAFINAPLYHYWKDKINGSYTTSVTMRSYFGVMKYIDLLPEILPEVQFKPIIERKRINCASIALRVTDLDYEIGQSVINSISVFDIIKNKAFDTKGLSVLCAKLFGLRFTRMIVARMYKQ